MWIKDIKPDTLNLIEDKVGKCLKHMGIGGNFLNRIPTAYALRSPIDKWDVVQFQRSLPILKANIQNTQRTQKI